MSYEEDHGYEVFGQNLFMAATERERENPVLKNDKERREFVQNSDNWETIGEMNGLVRLKRLTYRKTEWYRVEIMQVYQHFNFRKESMEWVSEWNKIGIYKIDTEHRAFTYGYSITQIADEIKDMDRKEKRK